MNRGRAVSDIRRVRFLFKDGEKIGVTEAGGRSNLEKGYDGECCAGAYYAARGFAIAERNWRYKKIGEVDIIAARHTGQPLLVFCEVKARSNPVFVAPAQAVNSQKQRRLRKLAALYIQQHPEYADYYVRFDIAEIFLENGRAAALNLLENAF